MVARRGYGKTQRSQKVQRGQNLSDHAQLLTTLSCIHIQCIYKQFFLKNLKYFINREYYRVKTVIILFLEPFKGLAATLLAAVFLGIVVRVLGNF